MTLSYDFRSSVTEKKERLIGPKFGPKIDPKGFRRGIFSSARVFFFEYLGGTFLGLSGGAKTLRDDVSNHHTL